jgi:hypothetical protein
MKRPARAHVLSLLAALVTIIAVSALWIVNLRMGPPLEAWTGGATVILIPLGLVILTAVWLVVRGLLHGRVHWRAVTVLAATILVPLAVVVVNCGPVACFVPGRPDYAAGWFIVGGVALTALVHHLVLNAMSGGSRDAA